MKVSLFLVMVMFVCGDVSLAQQVTESGELDFIQNIEWIDIIKINSAKEMKPYLVNEDRDYAVPDEGTEFIDHEIRYVTRAALDVAVSDRAMISYSDAVLRGDTLDILIYEFDESHSHNFQIRIIGNKHAMLYDYSYPVDGENRKITTINSALILNSTVFKKGTTIRGYAEYSGKCLQACEYVNGPILIKGNFVVVIR